MFEIDYTSGIRFFQLKGSSITGKILIFLPGIGACIENYFLHLDKLKQYFEQVYALDLPEQGSKGSWRIGQMVENLIEFISIIDNPNIKSITLGGHSAGALCAISCMANYNCTIEDFVNNETDFDLIFWDKLFDLDFAKNHKYIQKVDKLLLYAPPDSFNTVFPSKYSRILKSKSNDFVKTLLNIFINYPILLFRVGCKKQYFKFKITQTKKPQYFKLILTSYQDFFEYVSNYLTFFELFEKAGTSQKESILKIFENIKILVQYGNNDWLIKPFFGREKTIHQKYIINSETKVKKHNLLGHLLRKKMSLDINLNCQMITNKDVLKDTVNFIICQKNK